MATKRGTKVNGSHHGDNPQLGPTGIQIATKSYATLQAMAPTNNKTVHQTSFTPYREQPRSTRVVVAYPRPAFSATNRTKTFQPVLISGPLWCLMYLVSRMGTEVQLQYYIVFFCIRLTCVHVEPAQPTLSTAPPPLPCETHPAQRPSITLVGNLAARTPLDYLIYAPVNGAGLYLWQGSARPWICLGP